MIAEFPIEFVMECRMKMSERGFDYWFGQKTQHIFGYVKVRNCTNPKNVIVYEDQQYLKVTFQDPKHTNRNHFSIEPISFGDSSTYRLLKGETFDFATGYFVDD